MAFTRITTAYDNDGGAGNAPRGCNTGGNGGSAGQINVNAGELVVVSVAWEATDTTASMSSVTGLSWNAGTLKKSNESPEWSQMFYAIATQSVTNHTPTFDTVLDASYMSIIASVYSAGGTIVYDDELGESFYNANNPTSSGTLTVSGAAGLLVVGGKIYSGVTFTAGTNFTLNAQNQWNAQEYRATSSAGEYYMNMQASTPGNWAMTGMSFSESGGASTKPAYYYAQL